MKHLLKITLAFFTTLLVASMPLAGASAQPAISDQTFVSEVAGEEVDLGSSGDIEFIAENYDLRESGSFQEEYIWFTSGWSNFQLVMISGPNESAEYHDLTLGNMEDFYEDWELVDENITDEHSWFLGVGEVDGAPLVVYYEFELDAFGDIDLVTMQFSDPSTFQADLEFAQGEVTVGGEPLLPDTDAAELAELAGVDSTSPESSPESDDDGESNTDRSRTSRGGSTEADTEEDDAGVSRTSRGNTSDTDDEDATDADDDAEEDDAGTGRTSRSGSSDADTDEDDDAGTSRTSRGNTSETDDEDTTDTDDAGTSRTSRGNTSETDDEDTTDTDDDADSDRSRTSRGGNSDTDTEDDSDDSESGNNTRINRDGTTQGDDTDDDTTPVAGGDWDSMGLISDTEWESPSHGHIVSWDDATWEFPVDFEGAIIINDDPPYDVLTLQTTDGLGYVFVTVDLAYDSTPDSTVEYWTSEDYTDQLTNDVSVLASGSTSTSATMVYETTNTVDEPLIVVLEATFLDDGTVIYSQISAAPDTIQDVYGQYVDGVEVDGAPLEFTFTVEEIREFAGN